MSNMTNVTEPVLFDLVRQVAGGCGCGGFGWRVVEEAARRGLIVWSPSKGFDGGYVLRNDEEVSQ